MTLKKPAVLNNLFDELNFNKKTINKSNYLLKMIEKTIHLSSLKLRISYYHDDKKVINLLTKDTLGYMSRGLKFHPVQFSKKEIMQIITDAY